MCVGGDLHCLKVNCYLLLNDCDKPSNSAVFPWMSKIIATLNKVCSLLIISTIFLEYHTQYVILKVKTNIRQSINLRDCCINRQKGRSQL